MTWLASGVLGMAMMTVAANANAVEEDVKLNAFFKDYLEAMFQAQPMSATRMGDHRFDERLDDLSAPARAANLDRDRKTLADLPTRIAYEKLSRAAQVDFEIFRHHLTREIWLAEHFKPYEDDPRTYVGFVSESVYLPLSQSTLSKEQALAGVLKRMEAIPKVFETARASLKSPARLLTETAILQTKGAISFYENDIYLLTGQPKGEGDLGKKAKAIIDAAQSFVEYLEKDLLPKGRDDEWRIGKEKFARKLELELDAGLTADDVLAEAEREADRVHREMHVIARQLWSKVFPGKTIPPDDPEGRLSVIRQVLAETSKNHGTAQSLVNDAKSTVEAIKTFIHEKDILRLPAPDRCRIREMPEFMRGYSVAYLNQAPPLDVQADSEYAISPPPADWDANRVRSFLEEYNHAMLKILTVHEAYPGHYVQLEYSNRHPALIRRVLSSGTFAEGWAVYTEQMMLDQGFGDGDLALRLNQLKFYLRAVLNAILDNKMHTAGMTDAQALELLMGRGFQSEGEAVGKVRRAKQQSCQLSTYFVGRTAFYRLRQSIQRESGDGFELGRYHEAVLDHGTIPVKYLPELVRARLRQPR